MTILYVVYDVSELSEKTKEFLIDRGFLHDSGEDGNCFSITERGLVALLDKFDGMAGDKFWEQSGFSYDQRSTLEILWRLNPDAEARWE